ncbi:hypothetical protein [Actinoplanes sp. HUAS TT8]|uniref:hypothetical protein n=1 Tax=Actinoplanes sp. HUAS TT8 TaxID=3447453 RepID=UPI003F51B5F9
MGNYVSITSSPSDLINAADKIRDKGIALKQAVDEAVLGIRDHEKDTFPSDQYTDTFLSQTYHKMVPGADGGDVEASTAVTGAAVASGQGMQKVGEYVSKAMVNYDVADMEGADDIKKSVVKHVATRID